MSFAAYRASLCVAWALTGTMVPLASAAAQGMAPEAPEQRPRATLATADGYRVNDADPESNIPTPAMANQNPLEFGYFLMDLAEKAEGFVKRKEYDRAAAYYRAMAKAVPERSVSFQKLCDLYEAAGQRTLALEACRTALDREGARVVDFEHYVRLALAKDGPLLADDLRSITQVLEHLKTQPNTEASVARMSCRVAVRQADREALEHCTSVLARVSAKTPETEVFGFALAMADSDYDGAQAKLAAANASGLDAASLSRLQTQLNEARRGQSVLTRVGASGGRVFALVCAAMLALFAIAFLRRRVRTNVA